MSFFVRLNVVALTVGLIFSSSFVAPNAAKAAGAHKDGHDEHQESSTGAPGAASGVTRTIEVVLRDNFFEPESIRVKPGETIRFKIINAGEFVHEFNIGTAEMHAEHQGEMAMMVEHNVLMPDRIDMKAAAAMQASMGHGMHDDPNSVLLEPGHTGEVIWTFPEGGEIAIEFGCNVPGHYEAGMVGEFEVQS
ncbi:MAG: plastocyanin/azurin family copper-binding protein [Proteobacteria bacterium]|nr:plastocyanin/azurin family copper-binding protein [Pseudomonadota bacterium]